MNKTEEKMKVIADFINEVNSRIPEVMTGKPLMHMTIGEILYVFSVMAVAWPD